MDETTGIITGLNPPYIFDRYLRDQVTKMWLSEYAEAIYSDAAKIASSLSTADSDLFWVKFNLTNGGALARTLYSTLATTPNALVSWFEQNGQLKPATMYTPTTYESGSSFSHLDSPTYYGLHDFVMRSSGTGNVLIQDYQPVDLKVGIIGELVLGILNSMGYTVKK